MYTFSIPKAVKFGFWSTIEHFSLVLGSMAFICAVRLCSLIGLFGLFGLELFSVLKQVGRSAGTNVHMSNIHAVPHGQAKEIIHTTLLNLKGHIVAGRVLIPVLIFIVVSLVCWALQMGYYRIQLNIYDNDRSEFRALFSCFDIKKVFTFAVATLLYWLIVGVGFMLFFVPGIIFMYKYCYYGYAIVEGCNSPIEALKQSSQLTQGSKGHLIAMAFLLGILSLVSSSIFGLGILVVGPMTGFAFVCAYRCLQGKKRAQ